MKKTIALFILFGALLSGCFNDNYSELYPGASLTNGCDTITPVTYNKQISSLMNGYCTGCHSAGTANGNIALDTYSGTMNSAASGRMVASLRHQNGHAAMPPNSQLDECSIREVELWVKNNYPQ